MAVEPRRRIIYSLIGLIFHFAESLDLFLIRRVGSFLNPPDEKGSRQQVVLSDVESEAFFEYVPVSLFNGISTFMGCINAKAILIEE